jgi:hypothetical protein
VGISVHPSQFRPGAPSTLGKTPFHVAPADSFRKAKVMIFDIRQYDIENNQAIRNTLSEAVANEVINPGKSLREVDEW